MLKYKNKMDRAPVLLIAFNRPDTTQKVFDAIKRAKPRKLYVSVDGPRDGNIQDSQNVERVKEIFNKIDWECEVHKRFAEVNQGCGPGPYNAISWAFKREDRLIILEDDCVPAQSFFSYCDELLEYYIDDTRIWSISGNNFNEEAVSTPHSYFFSMYDHSWGWATWKRCWEHMDFTMSKWPLIINQDLVKSAFRTKQEARFFQKKFEQIYKNELLKTHIWDYQFMFAFRSNNVLSIVPVKNLVMNIGCMGTHSEKKSQFHNRAIAENYKIISHPDFILCDVNFDTHHFKHQWIKKTPIFKRVFGKIKRILMGKTSL